MKLTNKHGDFLELFIIQYQFPTITNGWDAEWLIIQGNAKKDGQSWKFRDPSLIASEVSSIIHWFEAIANDWDVAMELDFMEPNLRFERVGDYGLRIHLDIESRPEWAQRNWDNSDEDVEDFHIEFHTTPTQLIEAANILKAQLEKFPSRGN